MSARPYRIFTDATADFCPVMLKGLPRIDVIPMDVRVGDEAYVYGPGGNLSADRFYELLRAGQFASTSQINPEAYRRAFLPALAEGVDILYLGFSSGLSGTMGSARLAMEMLREEFPDRGLFAVDTLCASAGEAFIVREAARMQAQGMGIRELAAWVEENRLRVCHWFTVDGFEHLKRGGRVSAAAAAVGQMLDIKPMLHVDDEGKLRVAKKPRGRRRAIAEQIAAMRAGWTPEMGKFVVIGHGGDIQAALLLQDAVVKTFPDAETYITEIGPVIGAHTGPGMLALIYWGSNR